MVHRARLLGTLRLEDPEPVQPGVDIEHVRGAQLLLQHGGGQSADDPLAHPDTRPARQLSQLHLLQGLALHALRVGQARSLRREHTSVRNTGDGVRETVAGLHAAVTKLEEYAQMCVRCRLLEVVVDAWKPVD